MVLRSPEHSEQLCGKYFYWFQRYDVTEGRGGAGACRNLGPGSMRPPGHPCMCITGPGYVEVWGQLGAAGDE